jgi:hypothetical protein
MGNASASVASGHCARGGVMHPPVFSHRTAGGAVASVCILALGLVAAPPDSNVARSEVRAVQLAAFALPPAAASSALLEEFIHNQFQTVVPITPMIGGGTRDVPAALVKPSTAGVTAPLNVDSAVSSQVVNKTAPAALTVDPVTNAIFGPILAVVAFIFIFGVLIPAGFVVGAFYQLIDIFGGGLLAPLAGIAAPLAATADPNVTGVPSLTSDPTLSDPARITAATDALAEAAPATGTGKADGSLPTSLDKRSRTEQMTLAETATGNQQVSTETAKDVTESVAAEEESMGPAAVKDPEPSASASTSELAKPTGRPTTPRPVVRGPLGVGEQLRDLSHRGNGAAAARSSSAVSSSAASSSKEGSSSGGDSSDGDADGS